MEEKNMTDEQIINQLALGSKCCGHNYLEYWELCNVCKRGFDLVYRQKAKIERLTKENGQLEGYIKGLEYEVEQRQNQVNWLKKSQVVHIHIDNKLQKEYEYELNQAIKNIAKDIFKDIDNAFSLYYPHGQIPYSVFQDVIKQLAKKKGVEVE